MKQPLITISIVIVTGGLIYLVIAGNTHSWPKAQCKVVGSRVVRSDFVRLSRSAVISYRGQFHLQYVVGGRDYYVWADSGWSGKDKKFVEDMIGNLPEQCLYYVQYNPHNPAKSFAHALSN